MVERLTSRRNANIVRLRARTETDYSALIAEIRKGRDALEELCAK